MSVSPSRFAFNSLAASLAVLGRGSAGRARASWRTVVGCSVAAAVLAGCGGAQDPVSVDANGRLSATAIVATRPDQGGALSDPFEVGVIAIHMALQPDGRVMYYGSRPDGLQSGFYEYGVWDPSQGTGPSSVMILPNAGGTDLFCSSQTLLPGDGRLFMGGGDEPGGPNVANRNSNVFDYRTNAVTRGRDMWRERWYASPTVLMNGEIYLQGGTGGNDRPEVRQTDGSFRLLSGVNTESFDFWYPRNWVAPDGRIFGIEGGGQMYMVNPQGTGAVQLLDRLPAAVAPSKTAAAAMFRPGQILKLTEASPAASVIDITRGTPVVTNTEPASAVRVHGVATVLADGRVAVTGGSRVDNDLDSAAYPVEIWNPKTGEWTIGPRLRWARLYHGSALLLPDARVLVAGGGAPGPLTLTNGEIYTPPYLFRSDGSLAPRPSITAAPTVLEPGQSFVLDTAAAGTSRVTLVRFGSMTHSWNADQRFSDLPFVPDTTGTRLTAHLPSRATDTPPGFYLLFVFDANGVPSIARTVRINMPGAAPAGQTPVMADIADQSWTSGAVSLQPQATSPLGLPLRWAASGLPVGLSIDRNTGVITGVPSVQGSYFATVSASDGTWTASRSFNWYAARAPYSVQAPLPSASLQVNTDVNYTAAVSGLGSAGLQFSWSFGDGSPTTPFSTSPSATHRFVTPGLHTVTVTARSADGLVQTSSVTQFVGLPLGSTSPTHSTQMLVQPGVGSDARLWVVNPDNNSVTVIDTARRVRLAEVPVGDQPGTLAIARDGRIWVTNRRSSSISVIDPATLAVVRTISAPAGSQPSGVVADRTTGAVYVSLEAAGRVLRFDASTATQTGTVDVGPNARHLSLTADGTALFVSRFITPPLPGEATATVQPTADGTVRGGEVLRVATGGGTGPMALGHTVVLRHSDRPDFERQGRGVPNYLGPLVISPDATQGFVPSKQDNIFRGTLRDAQNLGFQNTVRAISSRVLLAGGAAAATEDPANRIDHDNASLASSALFDNRGILLFVALETSREVVVLNAHSRAQIMRIEVGRAPQALALSPDGTTLYVHNFMDRLVSAHDISQLVENGVPQAPGLASVATVATDRLSPQVLIGKQLFYDARDTRMARDRYMSCASCHSDGNHDGRVWDFTGFGEGLRNTTSLRGRAGMGHGRLHWSGNFDEVQDFEAQIRALAGGRGLMTDEQFNTGTRRLPLGDPKAGLNGDLDALAAYVQSLNASDPSPARASDGSLTAAAVRGQGLFTSLSCASCHGGASFASHSVSATLVDIGTIKPASGQRLGVALTGLDTPTLRDLWATAPYLHDGSATTIEAAVLAHRSAAVPQAAAIAALSPGDLTDLAQYLREIGNADNPAGGGSGGGSSIFTPAQLQVVGSARTTADGAVVLTAAQDQTGVVWARDRWATNRSFTTSFDVVMQGAAGRRMADGLAFALHAAPTGLATVGGGGGSLGIVGIPNVVAAALTSWDSNQGGFWPNLRPLGFALGSAALVTGRVMVSYDFSTKRLTFTANLLADGVARSFTESTVVDLAARFGPSMFAGVTAATGWGYATHAVSNWSTSFGPVQIPDVNTLPIVTNPGPQARLQGEPTVLSITAQDADGDTLTFSATGLPAGLSLSPTTGVISGSPTAAGTALITVNVSDGRDTVSTSFAWTTTAADITALGAGRIQAAGAARVAADGSALLTSLQDQAGAVWAVQPWSTAGSFSTSFDVNLTGASGRMMADGISFAMHNATTGLSTLGGGGGGLGMVGIPNVLAAAVVTWTSNSAGWWPNARPLGFPIGSAAAVTGRITVAYDFPTKRLVVAGNLLVDGVGRSFSDTVTVDLAARFGPSFFAGVTGATGWGYASQSIANWTVSFVPTGQAPTNQAPLLQAVAAQNVQAGTAVLLALQATDPDGDPLTYAATGLPPGVSVAPATGLISGTATTPGSYPVSAQASDGRGGQATASFVWTVTAVPGPVNRVPVLATPASQTTLVGTPVSLGITASDPDGDTLSYAATGLPAGLSINTNTGVIAGTPLNAGSSSVNVTISDGRGGTAAATFGWQVTASDPGANRAPVLVRPANQSTVVNGTVSLGIVASDPDGDALTYAATGLPAGLTISASTGVISGRPTTTGTRTVGLSVTDARGLTTTTTFTWTVTLSRFVRR